MIERLLIAGGGTGGHLFPGLAVVEELRRRRPNARAVFVGTERGIEARVLPPLGEDVRFLDIGPVVGRKATDVMRSLGKVPKAVARASQVLADVRPDVVVGVGGYAAFPLVLAARAMSIPTALLEQNAHVGLTNRMLAPVIGRAYVTFDETAPRFGARARVVGNPVRRAVVDAARRAMVDPEGFEARATGLLVLGGSQGSKALNELVPEAIAVARLDALGVPVVHQTGAKMRDVVEARYRALGFRAEVVPFIDDVARAYAGAALVVARAGATTLAELTALGRPSVLVPFPHAAEDHQAKNAEALACAGAALHVPEARFEVRAVADELRALFVDRDRRFEMATRARALGRPEAAAAIVDDLLAWHRELTTAGRAPRRDDALAASQVTDVTDEDDDDPSRRGLRVSPDRVPYVPSATRRRRVANEAPRRALVARPT